MFHVPIHFFCIFFFALIECFTFLPSFRSCKLSASPNNIHMLWLVRLDVWILLILFVKGMIFIRTYIPYTLFRLCQKLNWLSYLTRSIADFVPKGKRQLFSIRDILVLKELGFLKRQTLILYLSKSWEFVKKKGRS